MTGGSQVGKNSTPLLVSYVGEETAEAWTLEEIKENQTSESKITEKESSQDSSTSSLLTELRDSSDIGSEEQDKVLDYISGQENMAFLNSEKARPTRNPTQAWKPIPESAIDKNTPLTMRKYNISDKTRERRFSIRA
jgi:hypothetical protein